MYEHLLYTTRESIATITVNRPSVRNALNVATLEELASAFDRVKADAAIRVVILTGAGEKAFVAGADISEIAALTESTGEEFSRRGQAVFDSIESLGKPVIAAVNGYALGGGCELAMACTLRIAAQTAVFGQPEVKLGVIPGYGGTRRLPRLIGKSRALQLLLTGETIPADDALTLGLVDAVVPLESLREKAESIAQHIVRNAPVAVKLCLEAVNLGNQADEAKLFGRACGTEDMKEGTRAFLEKRAAEFKGR
ncbi:MAG TPA: enoyl-CoA hydratase-related protein [Terriglobia bacterium]|nr:enoyl-CoA hydratase-related protein [Terriglobia bacterium]